MKRKANSDDSPPEIENMDIPEHWIAVDMIHDIHIIPDECIDCFEHDLDFYDCFCTPKLVNKSAVLDGSERPVYVHNVLKEVRA